MNFPEEELDSAYTTHLVHSQLQDVATVHKNMLLQLSNSTNRDDSKWVSREVHDRILEELECERNNHHETQSLLHSEKLRREFAEGEVEILKGQMERERKRYEECLERLKTKASEVSAQKSEIASHCSAIAYERQQKEDQVHLNEAKIRDLKHRLSKQKQNHRREMDEANIRIQQEAYISKVVAQKNKKR